MKEESVEMVREKKHFIKDNMRMLVMLAIKKTDVWNSFHPVKCSAGEEPDHGDQDKAHPHPGLDCACAAR